MYMNRDMEVTASDAMLYAMEGLDPSQAIENMERRGQDSVCSYSRLPVKMRIIDIPDDVLNEGVSPDMEFSASSKIWNTNNEKYTLSRYEQLGIRVWSKHNDALYNVLLPDGWKIEPTEHSMWNKLVDSSGNDVATFFFKACFGIMDEGFIHFNN